MNTPQIPLYSEEAERALLGACIISPGIISELDITSADFYQEKHRMIWQAFNALIMSGKAVDYVSVCDELTKRKHLDVVGGSHYVTGLIIDSPSSVNAETYAAIITDKARRREMTIIASDIAKAAFDEKTPASNSTPAFIERMTGLVKTRSGAVHISEIMSSLYDKTSEQKEVEGDTWGIPTGFPTLDKVTGGLQPSEVMIVSGDPGVGKSMFVMQMAAQMAQNAPGAIYSLEMRSESVARRLISGRAKISTRDIKRGKMADWTGFTQAMEHFSQLPIYISDSSAWNTASLRGDLSRLKALYGIKWFVLDYLYLMTDGIGADEIERTALVSKGLKRAAMELDLAGVAVHSMNKGGMSSARPKKESLRGSGQVVYDADLITFLTPYSDEVSEIDNEYVKPSDKEAMRVLWFDKGRELEDPRKFIKFVKLPGYPFFGEATTPTAKPQGAR